MLEAGLRADMAITSAWQLSRRRRLRSGGQWLRSDGVPLTFVDDGNGTYTADLPHPGSVRISFVTVVVNGVIQRPSLTVNYKP